MLETTDVRVRPVDSVPWSDVESVFGTRGDPAGCWCQFFKLSNPEWKAAGTDGRSRMLREQSEAAPPAPGVLAYLGDEPVGWCAVEPRPNYPRLLGMNVVTRGSTAKAADASVWAVTCFVVRVGFRRRGLGDVLLAGAIEQARQGGARLIEAYPVDVSRREKPSSADLYHGPLSLFERAGFTVTARPSADRAVVQLILQP